MRKDIDITRAREDFARVFSQRILGSYRPQAQSKSEFMENLEEQLRTMTAAYIALTKFIKKDKLGFIKKISETR